MLAPQVQVPSRSSILVAIIFMILGGWKLIDIIVWISDHIYFIW